MSTTGWFDQIQRAVSSHGQTWAIKAGLGRLLVTRHGARILACQLPGVEGNLFWHSPDLLKPGGNITLGGGDRLWIAPESGYMWRDINAARRDPIGTYSLDPAMDPGEYRILHESRDQVTLVNEASLTDHRVNKRITIRMTRRITSAEAPRGLSDDVVNASFAIQNELTCLGGDDGAVAGAWDILQLPSTGTLVCPVVNPVDFPRSYYDPFGDRHVTSDDRTVRFLIDAKRRIKMGLSPTQTTGRMGYVRQAGDVWTLIVRMFHTLPGEPYVDTPLEGNSRFGGDALQAYNDNGGYGNFGEMEYHDPALVVGKSPETRTGASITHVMAGSRDDIIEAGRLLLGVDVM